MAGTLKRLAGPAFLAATSEDVYVPGTNKYGEVRHIHVANVNASARTVDFWLGATGAEAAGTQLFGGMSIAGNSVYDYYTLLRQATTDFLVGRSGTDATSLVCTVEGYEYAV